MLIDGSRSTTEVEKYKLTQNQIILRERGKTDERRIIESTS